MSSLFSLHRFTPFLLPFFVLQYPTDPPANPDSFPTSNYYNAGKLDICLVISLIAIMAILRDAFRLGVFEPFARWKLTRDLNRRRKEREAKKHWTNGHANGNGTVHMNGHALANGNSTSPYTQRELHHLNRSVLRFAEQGWSVVYYSLQWCYGLVGPSLSPLWSSVSHMSGSMSTGTCRRVFWILLIYG